MTTRLRGVSSTIDPTPAKHLLVVYHSQSGGAETMAGAVLDGAMHEEIEGVEVRVRPALEATVDDTLWGEAVILGTPENFGYMSGALKHFFDTIYYPCLDRTLGKPYALFVKASTDGHGAVSAVQRIATGLGWREVQPPIVVVGELAERDLERCTELGMSVAAGLAYGLY